MANDLAKDVADRDRLDLGDATGQRLKSRFIDALPPGLWRLRKKDAHPENWLIGPGGEVVMMDFEAKALLPVFLEVAQLLDDYPLCSVDDQGWAVRLGLAEDYLEALGPAVGGEDTVGLEAILPQAYGAFVLSRAVAGLARLVGRRARRRKISSSAALHNVAARVHHAISLIDYVAESAQDEALAGCAQEFGSAIRRTRPDLFDLTAR